MARGDFHTHSRWSDGVLTPTALVERAAAHGVRVLSLTDHDTLAGVAEATAAGARAGVRVVPGVEVSTDLPDGGEAHLLGYFVGGAPAEFEAALARLRAGREGRGRAIL